MKLHKTSVDRILRAISMWGGRSSDDRLIQAISNLDFQVYEQKNGSKTIVTTEEMNQQQAVIAQQQQKYIK